jgi:hypothetical protein
MGWICAVITEYVAAQEFLEEEHEGPTFLSPNHTNNYTLGKMDQHDVVSPSCLMVNMGPLPLPT